MMRRAADESLTIEVVDFLGFGDSVTQAYRKKHTVAVKSLKRVNPPRARIAYVSIVIVFLIVFGVLVYKVLHDFGLGIVLWLFLS